MGRGDYKVSLCIYRIWWNPSIERIHNILIRAFHRFFSGVCFQYWEDSQYSDSGNSTFFSPVCIFNIGRIHNILIRAFHPFSRFSRVTGEEEVPGKRQPAKRDNLAPDFFLHITFLDYLDNQNIFEQPNAQFGSRF